jgi:hypothetical protein
MPAEKKQAWAGRSCRILMLKGDWLADRLIQEAASGINLPRLILSQKAYQRSVGEPIPSGTAHKIAIPGVAF